MGHILFFDEEKDKDLTIEGLVERIKGAEKMAFKDMKLTDLIYDGQSLTGIYVVFNEDDKPIYVGKSSSRAILERIAAHFDLRSIAFMNSYLCALAGKYKGKKEPQANDAELKEAYKRALEHKLVFVSIKNCKEYNKIETALMYFLETGTKPGLNKIRGKAKYRETDRIIEMRVCNQNKLSIQ